MKDCSRLTIRYRESPSWSACSRSLYHRTAPWLSAAGRAPSCQSSPAPNEGEAARHRQGDIWPPGTKLTPLPSRPWQQNDLICASPDQALTSPEKSGSSCQCAAISQRHSAPACARGEDLYARRCSVRQMLMRRRRVPTVAKHSSEACGRSIACPGSSCIRLLGRRSKGERTGAVYQGCIARF
jgi:hypothetical protein